MRSKDTLGISTVENTHVAETRILVGESMIHGDFGEVLQNLRNGLGEPIYNDFPCEQATWLPSQSIVQKLQIDTPARLAL